MLVVTLITITLGVLTVVGLRRDPRWLGNAVLTTATLLGLFLTSFAGHVPASGLPAITVGLGLLLAPLAGPALIVALIWNGIVMIRREGRALSHLLSLLAGIGLLVVLVGGVIASQSSSDLAFVVAMAAVLATGWLGLLFVGYVGYAFLYQQIVRQTHPDYIMVLGSGLSGDRVPPLLASRIDRGIALYAQERRAGRSPLLVMSGGKGSDEKIAEGVAMARFARDRGVPPADLIVEDRSATTEQNLRFTSEIVAADPRLGPTAAGTVVTSDFHAMRAAALARRLGLSLHSVGAPTARYYWPCAVLREFVAIINAHRWWHVAALILVSVPLPAALFYALSQR